MKGATLSSSLTTALTGIQFTNSPNYITSVWHKPVNRDQSTTSWIWVTHRVSIGSKPFDSRATVSPKKRNYVTL